MTDFPTVDRYGFPVEPCGRCGGTGRHSYNAIHGDVCYGCNGKRVRHTKKARTQFAAWSNEMRSLRQAQGKDVKVGEELAILDHRFVFNQKVIGWHTVTAVEVTGETCGWSIQRDENGNEVQIPTCWRMVITFDDGEVHQTATNSVFRRKGWIDPAPYVAASQPGRRRKVAQGV